MHKAIKDLQQGRYQIKKLGPWQQFLQKFYTARPELNTSNTWFVSVYNGLGDAFFILGFLKEFKRFHSVEKLVVIHRKGLSELVMGFRQSFDASVVVETDLQGAQFNTGFNPNCLILSSKTYLNQGDWVDMALSNNIPIIDWYKYGLRLPMKSPFAPPSYPKVEVQHLIDKLSIEKGRAVILLPYTNFGARLSMEQWELVAKSASDQGLKVLTNCRNTSAAGSTYQQKIDNLYEAIPGTVQLDCSMSEFWEMASFCGYIASGVGGLIVTAVFTEAKCLVIHEDFEINGGTLNSRFEGQLLGPIDTIDSVQSTFPYRKNITEITTGEKLKNKLDNFFSS